MRSQLVPFLVLLGVLGGCELPSDAAPVPSKAPDAAKSAAEAKKAREEADRRAAESRRDAERRAEEERRAATERERDRQSATRTVDGRQSPRLRAREAAASVASLVEFHDPGAPKPFAPPAGRVVVAARGALLAQPAMRKEAFSSLVVQANEDADEWEAALLRRGANVLDRSMMSLFERELLLQEAMISDADAAALARKDPLLAPGLLVVGRDALDVEGMRFWMRVGGQGFQPLLSGRAMPPSARLAVGIAESAGAVLRLEEISWGGDDVSEVVARPVAKSVGYGPQFGDEVAIATNAATWQPDAKDAWLRTCKDGLTYFDVESKALWRIDRAWLGGPVTREAYIKARTRDESPLCGICRRPLPGKQKVVAPDEKSTPSTWWCPECDQSQAVAYFDGYALSGSAHDHDHAVAEWRWVAPAPGLYPVLTPPAGRVGQAFELGGGANWTFADLEASLAPAKLLADTAPRWCWVRADGSAVVIDQDELETLARRVQDGRQLVRMPVCEPSGALRYVLEREPVELAPVSIPVVTAELKVRMAMTATTRLAIAGRFALDYRNLLARDVEIAVGVDGPDLSEWPGVDAQRQALIARLRELVAETVVK